MLISLASDYFLFPSKIFPFLFFLFSPSPLTLGFSDIWYSAIFLYLCLSVCLSVCLTHTQSLVYISSLTPSPGLKLLRAIFLPSYITCNRQRALDYLRWWRFILKTLQRKRERPHREGGGAAAHGQASQRRERGLSRTPRGSPDAHVALLCPPTWAGAVLDSRCDSAALGRFLLHFWLLASLCRRLASISSYFSLPFSVSWLQGRAEPHCVGTSPKTGNLTWLFASSSEMEHLYWSEDLQTT